MTGRPVSAYRALASTSRITILHVLQQAGRPLTLADVARETGLHQSTTREHLDRLVAARFATKAPEARRTRGRPHMLYQAVDRPALADADEWFRSALLRVLLTGYGKAVASRSAAATEAGEELAASLPASPTAPADPPDAGAAPAADRTRPVADPALRQLAELEAHLDDLRFAPEIDPDGERIHLRHCPFLDLARAHTDVVCSVHLGIARGVLARGGGPVVAERLDPFVGPQHCVLHLARRAEPESL